MTAPIHLLRKACDQGPVSWCNGTYDSSTWRDSENIDEANCDTCLLAAFEFGLRAMRQRLFLKDGTLLDLNQCIERLLDQLASPVLYVHEASVPPRKYKDLAELKNHLGLKKGRTP